MVSVQCWLTKANGDLCGPQWSPAGSGPAREALRGAPWMSTETPCVRAAAGRPEGAAKSGGWEAEGSREPGDNQDKD